VDAISAIQLNTPQVSALGLSPLQSQLPVTPPTAAAAQGTTGTTTTHGHHHHRGGAMSAASQLLGMSTSDLGSALQSGQSLASIASSQGVSQSALVGALAAAIKGSNSNLTADQATQIATQMANRTSASQTQPAAGLLQAAASTWAAGTQQTPVSTFEVGA
jgi:hypothetical protein